MEAKQITTPYDALTFKIIGCAMAVHRELGPGLREDTYQRALANKLVEAKLSFEEQKLYAVYEGDTEDRLIGYYVPDYVVEEKIIVEIKALNCLDNSHMGQIIGYLAVTTCPLGLLINFGEQSLRYRRVLPPQKVIQDLVNRRWLYIPDWLKNE